MVRLKATATIEFYVSAKTAAEAEKLAVMLAEDMEPDRPIRYLGQPYRLAHLSTEPAEDA